MARSYRVTADMKEKEKAVGGVLEFEQAGWLALGLIICGAIFVALSSAMPKVLALVIGIIPGLGIGLPFAFFEKGGLRLRQYLVWRVKFARKSKEMVNTMTYRLDRAADFAREEKMKGVDLS